MIQFIKKVRYPLLVVLLAMITFGTYSLQAATINSPGDKDSKGGADQNSLQARTYKGVFDVQKNTVSNLDFYTSNYGIFGFDIARGIGGGYWPRSSENQ